MRYHIDTVSTMNGMYHIRGWAGPTDMLHHFDYTVKDSQGEIIEEAQITRICRPDVASMLYRDLKVERLGFYVLVPTSVGGFILVLEEKDAEGNNYGKSALQFSSSMLRFRSRFENHLVFRSCRYIRKNGMKSFCNMVIHKTMHVEQKAYQRWFDEHKPTAKELEEQRNKEFALQPQISIIVPVFRTPIPYLDAMIGSVQAQTYSNWQLCLANGSPEDTDLVAALKEHAKKDPRIAVNNLEDNLGIAGNTNAALALAEGEYIALLDHDDILAPNALYEFVFALNRNPKLDMFYSDEDKIEETGIKHFEPHFKPDFNLDLFRTNNYICHFFMVKKSIVDSFGGFQPGYDGAQDYDFILRCSEKSQGIYHVPKVLYHWRCHINSTASNPESKSYAYDAGCRALQAHYDRQGLDITAHRGVNFGWYTSEYHLSEHPLVTVMIPNKDHVDELKRCIDSIYEKTTYDNFEVLIIENNSTQEETFAYYNKLEVEHANLQVVYYEGGFNYAAINNFGFQYAKGEYVLLLNNDVEVISENIFEHMLGFAMRKDVGIVGAKLYYDDDTIQHAGVVVGINGVAAHAFSGVPRGELGYMCRASVCQNYSAVTGACMMVKSELYRQLNGLDAENFAVAFNDIDFCLRAIEKGYLVVFDAEVELYHAESKSRGFEDTPEKLARFSGEIDNFLRRWQDFVAQGDPCYNPNFDQRSAHYVVEGL